MTTDFQRIGYVDLGTSDYYNCAFIDKTNKLIYCVGPSNVITKIGLSPVQKIASVKIPLNPGVSIWTSCIDLQNGYIYLATDDYPSQIIRLKTADLSYDPISDVLIMSINRVYASVIDTINGFAYFGSYDDGRISQINLSNFTEANVLQSSAPGFEIPIGAIDNIHGYFYLSNDFDNPPDVVKIKTPDFIENTNITLPNNETGVEQIYVDSLNQKCYMGTWNNYVIKADVSNDSFTEIASVTGPQNIYTGGCIDLINQNLYIGGDGYGPPGVISKIDLNNFTGGVVSSITLENVENYPDAAVIDEDAGFAYFLVGSRVGSNTRLVVFTTKVLSDTGILVFTSNPSGAEIYIDGIDTGKMTPASITVSYGNHYWELMTGQIGDMYYYNTNPGVILVLPGQTIDIDSTLLHLPVTTITNGTFDVDLSGWDSTIGPFCEYNPGRGGIVDTDLNFNTSSGPGDVCGNGKISWDTGKTLIQTYHCSNTSLSQSFIVNSRTLSFDWQTSTTYEAYGENPGYSISQDSNILVNNTLSTNNSGTQIIDLSGYVGQTVKLSFYVNGGTEPIPPFNVAACAALDHQITNLWVDNVENIIPILVIIPPPKCIIERDEGIYSKDRYCYVGEGIFKKF